MHLEHGRGRTGSAQFMFQADRDFLELVLPNVKFPSLDNERSLTEINQYLNN